MARRSRTAGVPRASLACLDTNCANEPVPPQRSRSAATVAGSATTSLARSGSRCAIRFCQNTGGRRGLTCDSTSDQRTRRSPPRSRGSQATRAAVTTVSGGVVASDRASPGLSRGSTADGRRSPSPSHRVTSARSTWLAGPASRISAASPSPGPSPAADCAGRGPPMLGSFPHPTSCTHILAHPGDRGHPWLGKGFPGNTFRIFTYGDVPLIMGGSRIAAAAVARGRWPMAMPSTDADELAKFGYKQELDRSLGCFLVRPPGSATRMAGITSQASTKTRSNKLYLPAQILPTTATTPSMLFLCSFGTGTVWTRGRDT